MRLNVAASHVIIVPVDYPTIQQAIDHANNGDTVLVRSGIYYEHLIINKPIFLEGENKATTIVSGNGTDTVIVVNSTDVQVDGLTVEAGSQSGWCIDTMQDGQTTVTVTNTIIRDSFRGINVGCRDIFRRNEILFNYEGIYGCQGGSHNEITESVFAYNVVAIYYFEQNNIQPGRVYHNAFLHNNCSYIATDIHTVYADLDNGSVSGGNYWSDYNGTDSNHDGIGDTPQVLIDTSRGALIQDRYPLMAPLTRFLLSDVNRDGTVNILDVFLLAKSFGSGRGQLTWNPNCDINDDGLVNILDIVTVARNFGKSF